MATVKYNKDGTTYSCWSSTERVTTPSLCFKEGSTTKYVPLLAISAGEEEQVGDYSFKVGNLCARHNGTIYRAVISRSYASSISGTISTTITHSGTGGTTTTQTVEKARTVSTKCGFMQTYPLNNGSQTWYYKLTFKRTPSISNGNSSLCSVSAYTNRAVLSPTTLWKSLIANAAAYNTWTVSATGYIDVNETVTTYPSETISATASGDFAYGVTFTSAPTLSVTSGDVSVSNNPDNASFHASKTLTGTVEYGKNVTLSQAFTVSIRGAI